MRYVQLLFSVSLLFASITLAEEFNFEDYITQLKQANTQLEKLDEAMTPLLNNMDLLIEYVDTLSTQEEINKLNEEILNNDNPEIQFIQIQEELINV